MIALSGPTDWNQQRSQKPAKIYHKTTYKKMSCDQSTGQITALSPPQDISLHLERDYLFSQVDRI
jgi:hypothetical protein